MKFGIGEFYEKLLNHVSSNLDKIDPGGGDVGDL
jgi:hypothetical protein